MYAIKFRRKVLSLQEKANLTNAEVASRFDIGVATVVRWRSRIDPFLKRNKPATRIDMQILLQDVVDYPDKYLYERAKLFGASSQGIVHALRRLGVSYKKNSNPSKSKRRRKAILPETNPKTQAK